MEKFTKNKEGRLDGRNTVATHRCHEVSRCPATACSRQNDQLAILRTHDSRQPDPRLKAPAGGRRARYLRRKRHNAP